MSQAHGDGSLAHFGVRRAVNRLLNFRKLFFSQGIVDNSTHPPILSHCWSTFEHWLRGSPNQRSKLYNFRVIAMKLPEGYFAVKIKNKQQLVFSPIIPVHYALNALTPIICDGL